MTDSTSVETHGVSSVVDPPIDLRDRRRREAEPRRHRLGDLRRRPRPLRHPDDDLHLHALRLGRRWSATRCKGQEVISSWQQYAGWIVMATAPFLGASIDKLGPRKRWLALVVPLMVPLIAALWWAKPDGSGLTIVATMSIAMMVNVLFAYSEVLHNSLLVRAAGLEGRAQGLGPGAVAGQRSPRWWRWASRPGPSPCRARWTGAGCPRRRCSAWTPRPTSPSGWWPSWRPASWRWARSRSSCSRPTRRRPAFRCCAPSRDGAADLWGMLKTVRPLPDAVIYLVSRMFFVDGMNGVLFFFGVLRPA